MKNCLFILGLLVCLVACEDQIHLKTNRNMGIAVYCFPTEGDSLDIEVSSTESVDGQIKELKDVRVSCTLNNKLYPAVFVKDINEKSGIPMQLYRLRHSIKKGDIIGLQAKASGFQTITSTATVPLDPTISRVSLDTLFIKGEWYVQIRCTIKNSPQKNYFAVRVLGQEDYGDSLAISAEGVDTSGEPILNNYNTGDDGFNTSNDFYHDFYTFDNTGITDSTYTLHLNMPEKNYIIGYRVQLFRITPAFYSYMKSLNDIQNNNFNDYGMSFIRPSFTNIQNGIGILGAYSNVQSGWLK